MAKGKVPGYCRQRRLGCADLAFVELGGRRHYLGEYGTEESRKRYAKIIERWEAEGRRALLEPGERLTVVELVERYLGYADGYYVQEGKPTSEAHCIRLAVRPLLDLYGEEPADSIGPAAVKRIRASLIDRGIARKSINKAVDRVRRAFKWAVAEELIPVTVYQALLTVPGLKRGRTKAIEPEPVHPAPEEDIAKILPRLSRQVRVLIQLQLLTGARPGELVILRPCDLDRSDDVWLYKPTAHKTAFRGLTRTIYIGPRGQEVLRPFLARRAPGAFCFSPIEAEAERRAAAHAKRKTPESCGNTIGSNVKRNPKRRPAERYTVQSYRKAIARACKAAKVSAWSPHQLRHNAGTKARKSFGLEAAQLILGHQQADVTQIYAERDAAKAIEIARRIG